MDRRLHMDSWKELKLDQGYEGTLCYNSLIHLEWNKSFNFDDTMVSAFSHNPHPVGEDNTTGHLKQ